MIAELRQHRQEVVELCRRFGVRRLDVFGSATSGDFDPACSDIDFLVEFEPPDGTSRFDGVLRAEAWDARRAAALVSQFVADRSWADYEADPMLRSAVERQFEILGEALNQPNRVAPHLAAGVADLPRIVAFRNLLIHRYVAIDDRLVWEVANERVAPLIAVLDDLLGASRERCQINRRQAVELLQHPGRRRPVVR